jgi:preprotein translocase subunit SecG
MTALFTTIHITAAVIMILVVLLQSGKSADLAGAFGGGGSQTAFGPRGAATLLSKMTTASAIIFMVTSFTLAIMASKRSTSSVLEGSAPVSTTPQSVPQAPPTTPTPAPAAQQSKPGPSIQVEGPNGQPVEGASVSVEKKSKGKAEAKPGKPEETGKAKPATPDKKQ